jgi:uncharacterized membrane protein (UPF0127 family)
VRKPNTKFNYAVPIVLLLIIIVVGAALLFGSDKPEPKPKTTPANVVNTSCGPYRKDGVVTINGSQINVETVAGTKDLEKGLSGRPCIESDWGMLFDFGRDGQYAIWMKDMKFPIDVIWINSAHNIVAIEADFQPSSYPEKRANQSPARYVLEVKANLSKELNLSLGQLVSFHKS